jgi:hypothetical protein
VLWLEEVAAIARFHFDGYVVEVALELGVPIPTAEIPIPATRYATARPMGIPSIPGEVLMGWFEIQNPNHSIYQQTRPVAFDLSQNITEAMLTDGVLDLYGSWLQFGDVNGSGAVTLEDFGYFRRLFLGGIDLNDIIGLVADVNVNGHVTLDDMGYMRRFALNDSVFLGPRP